MLLEFEREKILQFFYAIKEQASEGVIHIENNNLRFYANDFARACFLDANFKVDTSEKLELGVDCNKFYSTINALKTKKITIDFGKNTFVKGGKIEREIRHIEISALKEEKIPPKMNFPVKLEIPCEDFTNIIDAVNTMGVEEGALPQKVILAFDKTKLTAYSINELLEKTNSEFDMISVEEGKGTVHSSGFGFDHLLGITKAIKKNKLENLKLSMNTNYPCKIEVSNDVISLSWLLAPRVEDD